MNTTFIISGGAGRVVTSIPALEKYHRLNPTDDFKVLVHGWHQLFWSHPLLQNRTYDANIKGTFEYHIKDNNVVVPEPYHLHSFFNQQKNMCMAFDEIINQTNDHSDLSKPNLYTSDFEFNQTAQIFNEIKQNNPNKKIVVFQPFGSGCKLINNYPFDGSHRSLSPINYKKISEAIKDIAVVIYASSRDVKASDDTNIDISNWNPYFRVMPGFIQQCDYFVGCDSVGQHVARAFEKPGTVIMGATNDINFSYPDFFNVVRTDKKDPVYNPWRLSDADVDFIDRTNQGIMDFDNEEIDQIIHVIRSDLEKTND